MLSDIDLLTRLLASQRAALFNKINIQGDKISLSSPRGARNFHELRRYHTRPLRLNWGPENVHFGKTHFWDPNINLRIFIFFETF